jgi:hypothetical protein
MTKPKTWTCGDCGCQYRIKVKECKHYFDDYLGVRKAANVDEAIQKATQVYMYMFDKAIWLLQPNKLP